jgi:hypothetical protein
MSQDDRDFLDKAHRRITAAWRADSKNRIEATKDLEFLAGEQWPASIRLDREASNRPCLTINQLPQFVNQVTNDMRMNPREISFSPADGAASKETAKIYTGLARHIQNQSRASAIYADAGKYAVSCGIGHFRLTTDYTAEDAFEQDIIVRRIDGPLSVYWDASAREPDRSDANFCFVTEQIDEDTFKERYPDASLADIEVSRDDRDSVFMWRSRDYVLAAEYWWKEPITRTYGRDAQGRVADLTDVDKSQWAELQVVATKKVKSHRVKMALICGSGILEKPVDWAGMHIPIFPVIGSETVVGDAVYRHGLIRFARDPQALFNYWRSAAAEAIALAPKSPYLATAAMIGRYKAQWDTQNTVARPYLLYDPDPQAPGARPQREPAPELPAALVNESNMAAADLKSTIGIYDPQLGQRSNETSGRAIIAREKQGDTGTAHYSDNLTITLHHLGRVLCDLIPKIYDSERTVRILGQDEKESFVEINKAVLGDDGQPTLVNDMTTGKYDVKVKVGPSYNTARAEAANGMLQFVQAVPAAGPIIGDLIAKTQDWPGADEISARLKTLLPPQVAGLEIDEDGNPKPPPPPDPSQLAEQAEVKEMQRRQAVAQVNTALATSEKAKWDAEGAEFDARFKQYATAEKRWMIEMALGRILTEPQIKMASEPQDEAGEPGEAVGGMPTQPPASMPSQEPQAPPEAAPAPQGEPPFELAQPEAPFELAEPPSEEKKLQ